METSGMKGKCLCGAVEVEAPSAETSVGACHCNTCRRWGGGPLLAVNCGTDVSFTNEGEITRFQSSEWAERGFCRNCGTHLFYHLKGKDQYIMPAGLFENASGLNFDHQIFIDQKPPFYDFANTTRNMTGEEVFAGAGGD